MTITNETEISTRLGSIEIQGEAHPFSVWFILALRLMMGYAFLHAGLGKLTASEPFSAKGYLLNAVPAESPLVGLFHWMGSTPWFVDFLNIAVPWGELLIGIALLIGLLTRLAAFWGAFMMLMFYFSNWSVQHGFINGDFAYMLVFLSVAAFGAGRILGLDAYVEKHEVVQEYPQLRYLLG